MSIPDPIVLLDARAKYVHPAFQMSRASTKTVFDSAGRLVTVPANAIGWDHDPALRRAAGYLNEPERTNSYLYSTDLTDGNWSKRHVSVQASGETMPDGSTMFELVEAAATNYHSIFQEASWTSGVDFCVSVFAKAGDRPGIELRASPSGNFTNHARATFDVVSGQFLESSDGPNYIVVAGGVEPIGNDIFRVWAVFRSDVTATTRMTIGLTNQSWHAWYTGDGTSKSYVWGPQAEVGTGPTSYIATQGSTAVRSKDELTLSNLSAVPWWNSASGTVLMDAVILDINQNGMWFDFDQQMYMRFEGGGQQRHKRRLHMGGSIIGTESSIITASNIELGRYRVAIAWQGDSVVGCYNGGSVRNLSELTAPLNPSLLRIGWYPQSWARAAHLSIERFVYYPQRIPNADLQSLTAIQE